MDDVAAKLALGGWRPANRNDALLNDAVDVFVACVRYFLVGEMVDTTEGNRKIQLLEELARVFKLKADRYSDFTIPNTFLDPALVSKNDGLWDAIAGIHAGQGLARQVAMAGERRLPVVCFARFDGRHRGVPVRWQLWVRTQRPEPGTLEKMPYVPDWAWAPSGTALAEASTSTTQSADLGQRVAPSGVPQVDDPATSLPITPRHADTETPAVAPHPRPSNAEATAPPVASTSEGPQEPAPVGSSLFDLLRKTLDGGYDSIVYVVPVRGSSFAPRLFGYVAVALVFYFLGLDLIGTFFGGASAILSKIASVLSGQSLVSLVT